MMEINLRVLYLVQSMPEAHTLYGLETAELGKARPVH